MKCAIIKTLLILSIGAALPVTQALAKPQSQAEKQTSEESAEQDWQEALQLQVELAKAKVSLLRARTELWVEQNSEKAQRSLDEASASLDAASRHADKVAQVRIAKLKSQVKKGGELLKDKGLSAEAELHALAEQSEATLGAALAQAQARRAAVQDEFATRYALSQANAAALRARVALEIDKSTKQSLRALEDAEDYLQQAKSTANTATAEHVKQLQDEAEAARRAVSEEADEAKSRIRKLVVSTEKRVQGYRKTIKESEEARLLNKRYRQLEAEAALLKANLAAKKDATASQITAYLDESLAWYDSIKSHASERWNKERADMSTRINDVKQSVEKKDKQTRTKLAELLERAAAMLRDDKHE